MKKYLYSALALPLLFACSSENFDEKVISNDQFAGIEKVDATFTMDEGPVTRMDIKDGEYTGWTLAEGDKYGFAWLTDEYTGNADPQVAITGKAFQNHPLTQTSGIFKPATSIYVGKYFLYRPYDETVVSPAAINFKSLEQQTLAEGMGSKLQPWKSLAASAIIIGDKWTDVTPDGTYDAVAKKTWNKAGIDQHYDIYAAVFSNQTGLDLTYVNNNKNFDGKKIKGATDIDYTYPTGSTIGAADVTKVEVTLAGAAKSFTYAPTAANQEPVVKAGVAGADHSGEFWADKSGASAPYAVSGANGFNFTAGAITLNAPAGGVSTALREDNKAWFWFNSLPVSSGDADETANVTTVFYTSYGNVTVAETLEDCAYAFEVPKGAAAGAAKEWIKLADATDQTKTPKEWDPAVENTFINQYGNHKGKYELTVDFKNSDMSVMHIQSDEHLQKALKFYIASGKTENVVLNLDKEADGNFKISKISIALIQTIKAQGHNVKVQACGTAGHTPAKIIITQEGQTTANGLADKTAVPALDNVFAAATDVYLAGDGTTWTWSDEIKNGDVVGKLTIDGNVSSITNLGTLNVTTTNIELSVAGKTLKNDAGATMNITKVTTVKNALTNLGTINVGSAEPQNYNAELRAYGVAITNDATALNASGTINNWGVVGVTYNTGVGAQVNNYGTIDMKQPGAITLLTSNEVGGAFQSAFNAGTNKLGTVKLPGGAPNALVSVSNGSETGFIEYVWDGGTTYATPNSGTVKYNTIIVSTDIKFTEAEDEIKYIKFNGVRTQVINPTDPADNTDQGHLGKLKGIIVEKDKSIIIEKNNGIVTTNSAHLKSGAAIYQGGIFNPQNADIVGKTVTDYLGTWSTDQVVVY